MTDRELAGCALLPCNFPCEKCGSQDIARAFRPEGEKWRVEVYGRAESKYAYADAYVATSSRDHINHRCRCCQYEWQTLPMKKQRRNRRTPSSEGDGIPQVEGLTVEREAGALSQSGERFPDLFVIRLGDREDCVIKGEQPALWAMFDAAIAAAEGSE